VNETGLPERLKTGIEQLSGLSGDIHETLTNAFWKLWKLLKASHNNKTLPLLLNILNVITVAVRYAKEDSSMGAQIGAGVLAISTLADAAVTAVEEWKIATDEGKDLWKKRVDALEKVSKLLVQIATVIGLPIDPVVGFFIRAVGTATITTLRQKYNILRTGGGEVRDIMPSLKKLMFQLFAFDFNQHPKI
jgi:hypothetical protein